MTREGADTKGRRYLTEGRLTIAYVSGDHVNAYCRGEGQVYRLGHNPGGWYCSCAARTDQCCHLAALRLVTIRRREQS